MEGELEVRMRTVQGHRKALAGDRTILRVSADFAADAVVQLVWL